MSHNEYYSKRLLNMVTRRTFTLLLLLLILGSPPSSVATDPKSSKTCVDVRSDDEFSTDGGIDPESQHNIVQITLPEGINEHSHSDDGSIDDEEVENEKQKWEEEEEEEEDEWCDECDWEEVVEALGCTGIAERSVPNDNEYMTMRQAYEKVVGVEDSTISPITKHPSFLVPLRAGPAGDGKGRGIFATSPIRQGEAMWTSRQTATFYDAYSFREFLGSIPRDNACDILYWAYSHSSDEEGPMVSVELDHTALCNDAGVDGEMNVGCDQEMASKLGDDDCSYHMFAMKDINVGDELLCLYADFSGGEEGWAAFGMA